VGNIQTTGLTNNPARSLGTGGELPLGPVGSSQDSWRNFHGGLY
jgi:hypothetical protein